jgi:hypothetical protein
MACEVEVVAGTDDLLRDRARLAAEAALALVRQQVLFGGMYKIYLDQVMFGLDGRYTFREGAQIAEAGCGGKRNRYPWTSQRATPAIGSPCSTACRAITTL